MPTQRSFETYEGVARAIFNDLASDLGIGVSHVEPKQTIPGRNTSWTIDAKGVCENDEGFIIVECRRYTTSRQSQESIGALAYRIQDTGANGGIIVSPLGLQAGGERIAEAENIHSVLLDADATPEQFFLRFLERVFVRTTVKVGIAVDAWVAVRRPCEKCGREFRIDERRGDTNINERRCSDCRTGCTDK